MEFSSSGCASGSHKIAGESTSMVVSAMVLGCSLISIKPNLDVFPEPDQRKKINMLGMVSKIREPQKDLDLEMLVDVGWSLMFVGKHRCILGGKVLCISRKWFHGLGRQKWWEGGWDIGEGCWGSKCWICVCVFPQIRRYLKGKPNNRLKLREKKKQLERIDVFPVEIFVYLHLVDRLWCRQCIEVIPETATNNACYSAVHSTNNQQQTTKNQQTPTCRFFLHSYLIFLKGVKPNYTISSFEESDGLLVWEPQIRWAVKIKKLLQLAPEKLPKPNRKGSFFPTTIFQGRTVKLRGCNKSSMAAVFSSCISPPLLN